MTVANLAERLAGAFLTPVFEIGFDAEALEVGFFAAVFLAAGLVAEFLVAGFFTAVFFTAGFFAMADLAAGLATAFRATVFGSVALTGAFLRDDLADVLAA